MNNPTILELQEQIRLMDEEIRRKDQQLARANEHQASMAVTTMIKEKFDALGVDLDEAITKAANKPPKALPTCRYTHASENFTIFRGQFMDYGRLYAFTDQQLKLAIWCCLKGEAAESVADLRIHKDNGAITIEEILDLLEERFNPNAQKESAAMRFDRAEQLRGEPLLRWHARARHLWTQAFPHKSIDDDTLIRKFVGGIRDTIVRKQTKRGFCSTYGEALERAQKEHSVEESEQPFTSTYKAYKPTLNNADPTPMEIGAMDKAKLRCYNCREMGHMSKECTQPRKVVRFSGTTNKNNYRISGAQANNWKKAINEMAEACSQMEWPERTEEEERMAYREAVNRGEGEDIFEIGTDHLVPPEIPYDPEEEGRDFQ